MFDDEDLDWLPRETDAEGDGDEEEDEEMSSTSAPGDNRLTGNRIRIMASEMSRKRRYYLSRYCNHHFLHYINTGVLRNSCRFFRESFLSRVRTQAVIHMFVETRIVSICPSV